MLSLSTLALALALAAVPGTQRKAAATVVAQPDPATIYQKAVNALDNYNFNEAETLINQYESLKNSDANQAKALRAKIELAQPMLERVEKTVIVDSISMPLKDFFKAFSLSSHAGSLKSVSELPAGFNANKESVIYATEQGDHIMWGFATNDGKTRIAESSYLTDGTWEQPTLLNEAVNAPEATRVDFPFVLPDGVTLYFASNNPATSLGGLDIFITRRDGSKYLEPQNIGMPYNSPANDFMMAIDETTGAGWWATDRNSPTGMVTIYIFVPSELRVNYPADTPNLPALALLKDFKASTPAGFNRDGFLNKIKNAAEPKERQHPADFEFALPDGRIITSITQLSSDAAVKAFDNYFDKLNQYDELEYQLEQLRNEYRSDKSNANEIKSLENQTQKMRAELRRLSNIAVSAEMNSNQK